VAGKVDQKLGGERDRKLCVVWGRGSSKGYWWWQHEVVKNWPAVQSERKEKGGGEGTIKGVAKSWTWRKFRKGGSGGGMGKG